MSATTIGQPRRRRDGEPKVRGATRYTADLPVHGLLHGRLVLSAEAHARLTGVDGSAALEVPGVVAVLTAADLPLVEGAAGRAGMPLAREELLWSGQPVALVVAESEAAAQDGADLVDVETEPLEAVLDLEAAMADDAPAARLGVIAEAGEEAGAHGGAAGSDDAEAPASPNVAVRQRMHAGDARAGLDEAAVVVSGRFRTNWVHQGYLETQVALAWTEPDGGLVVTSGTQGVFNARQGLAAALGLPLDRVRVRTAPIGGAFGGKLMIPEPLAGAAALKLGRPVRIVFGRTEDFAAANPAPSQIIDLEIGATRDGKFTAIRGTIVADRGALTDMGVETISAVLLAGPYNWPAHDLIAVGVFTNHVGCGASRRPPARSAPPRPGPPPAPPPGGPPAPPRSRSSRWSTSSPPGWSSTRWS